MKFKKIVLTDDHQQLSRELKFGKLNLVLASNKKGKTLLYDSMEVILGTGDQLLLKKGDYEISEIEAVFEQKNLSLNVTYDSKSGKYSFIGTENNTKENFVKEYSKFFFGSEVHLINQSNKSDSDNFSSNHTQKLVFSFFPETRIGDLMYPFPKAIVNLRKRYQIGKVFKSSVANMGNEYYQAESFLENKSTKKLNEKLKSKETSKKTFEKSEMPLKMANEVLNGRLNLKDLEEIKTNIKENTDLKIISRIINLLRKTAENQENSDLVELNEIFSNIQNEIEINNQLINKVESKISDLSIKLSKVENELKKDDTQIVLDYLMLDNEISKIEAEIIDEDRIKAERKYNTIFIQAKEELFGSMQRIEKIMKSFFRECTDDYLNSLSYSNLISKYQFHISEKYDFGVLTEKLEDGIKRYHDPGSHALKTVIQVCYILSLHQYLNEIENNDYPIIVLDSISMPFSIKNPDNSAIEETLFSDLCLIVKKFIEDDINDDSQLIIIDKSKEWSSKFSELEVNVDFNYDIESGLLI